MGPPQLWDYSLPSGPLAQGSVLLLAWGSLSVDRPGPTRVAGKGTQMSLVWETGLCGTPPGPRGLRCGTPGAVGDQAWQE